MERKVKRFINADKEDVRFLMRLFRVTNVTIWSALNYKHEGRELHCRIRQAALEHGCEAMIEAPEFETWFTGTCSSKIDDRVMHQRFENGALLSARLSDGLVILENRHGERVREWNDPRVSELREIQRYASAL